MSPGGPARGVSAGGGTGGRPVRIALLTEIPAPFRTPLFNALAVRDDVEVDVLFLAERDPVRPHYRLYPGEMRFRWQVLPGREIVRGGRWVVLSRGVARRLLQLRPDVVVVGGWSQPAFWVALVAARLLRAPLVAWVESTARDARSGGGVLERAKQAMIARCAGFLVPGRASQEYLESLGVPGERIAIAPNAVDATIFRDAVAAARRAEGREALRSRLGIPPEGCLVLAVGRLAPEKGIDLLLAAAQRLEAAGVALQVAVVGAGPEDEALRAAAPASVRFTGALDRDELVPWYAAADAFVLPSRSEQWGMVLNEAAAAALPIVASDAAGAAWSLVDDGESGFRVPSGDAPALERALATLAIDPALRQRAGCRSAELAAAHTSEAWAAACAGLARKLVSRR